MRLTSTDCVVLRVLSLRVLSPPSPQPVGSDEAGSEASRSMACANPAASRSSTDDAPMHSTSSSIAASLERRISAMRLRERITCRVAMPRGVRLNYPAAQLQKLQ